VYREIAVAFRMRLTPTGLAIVVLAAALLVGVMGILREGFFGSPGTYVQLATSHVPTAEDAYYYKNVYPKEVRKEITDLTGGDPGDLTGKTYLSPYAGTYYLW
jgi:hypothetical protein